MSRDVLLFGFTCLLLGIAHDARGAGKVLILHDELPQMKVLAGRLEREGYGVDFVTTKEKLPELDAFDAIVVFVHGVFPREQADAVIARTRAGARLIALHHTISSAKLKTPVWLEFLGIGLPQPLRKPLEGGYAWQHDVDLHLVNLSPGHYITTNKIEYPGKTQYKRSDVEEPARERACIIFPESEVFLHHTYTDGKDKTVLFGFTARHEELGDKTWMQDRGGWLKPAGKGWIFYFMPGHTVKDVENPLYQQLILNCLTWTGKP